jgi:hypothetical protein
MMAVPMVMLAMISTGELLVARMSPPTAEPVAMPMLKVVLIIGAAPVGTSCLARIARTCDCPGKAPRARPHTITAVTLNMIAWTAPPMSRAITAMGKVVLLARRPLLASIRRARRGRS